MNKYHSRTICFMIGNIAFLTLLSALFLIVMFQSTQDLLASGGLVINRDLACNEGRVIMCDGIYDCAEQMCRNQQVGWYTTLYLPEISAHCDTDNFGNIWAIVFYKIAIIVTGCSFLIYVAVIACTLCLSFRNINPGVGKLGLSVALVLCQTFTVGFYPTIVFIGWNEGVDGGLPESAEIQLIIAILIVILLFGAFSSYQVQKIRREARPRL